MIPVKLRLRNFMCYRDDVPTLLLESIHVACLCGENGAGKSALLDAITWALWGQARARSDDDLIHMGRDEMDVELEFLVLDNHYRVIRKRQRSVGRRAGKTLLELHVSTGDGFRPITANTVRETQRRIIHELRMDYQTFINSSFLVQGRADEFTLKSADKRKEVLAEILNLRYYDRLEERAREEARGRRSERHAAERAIDEMARDLGHRREYRDRLEQVQEQLAERAQALARMDQAVQRLRSEKQALEVKEGQLRDLRRQAAELAEEEQRRRRTIGSLKEEVARHEAVVAEAEAVAEGHRELQEALERKERLDAAARAALELGQRRAALEAAIEKVRAELLAERGVLESQAQQLQPLVDSLEATVAELEQARHALGALDALEPRLAQRRGEAEGLMARGADLKAVNQQLRKEMEQLRANIDRLEQGEGVCPLCGTALGQDRCQDVLGEYQRQGEARKREHVANQAEMDQVQDAEQQARREAQELEARLKQERPGLQARVATLDRARHEALRAAADLPQVQTRLAAIGTRLADKHYASDEQRQLAEALARIEALGYDETAHDAAQADCQRLRPFEAQYRLLEEAQRRLPEERQRLHEMEQEAERKAEETSQAKRRIDELTAEVAGLPKTAEALAAAERSRHVGTSEADQLRQQLGAARRDLQRLDELEGRLAEKRSALAQAQEEQAIFEELTTAFSRRGVQALIIDSALPEIEDEANRLLGRMTDNRMHLKLETQSAYRSKEGVQETLEIRIADELGTRSYETFSGGEAFRINLALRIALSRLLARRAGAPLPTLFIDEGFGTQDPAGRDRIVQAINAIRDDFERIIVVTHIDELKEQFPARIEVEKTPEGSTFWLS
ncbi:MAG: SMC family ATPase [Dehalococcoidia bacterium]